MFKTRLVSGIILVLIALTTIIIGGNLLFFTLLIISLIGLDEFYRAVKITEDSKLDYKKVSILTVVGMLGTLGYFTILYLGLEAYTVEMFIFLLIVILGTYVFTFPRYNAQQIMAAFFGFIYVPVMLSYIYKTRMIEEGVFIVWLIFICSWGCDTSAYCVGMLFGKHKLAPQLSPKKSIEGAIGGILGAALLGGIYAAMVSGQLSGERNYIVIYAVICGVGAAISQIGDLAASAVKRNHEIKDYGTLIPGHGGILDRFDSVIFTAPIIYFMATMLT